MSAIQQPTLVHRIIGFILLLALLATIWSYTGSLVAIFLVMGGHLGIWAYTVSSTTPPAFLRPTALTMLAASMLLICLLCWQLASSDINDWQGFQRLLDLPLNSLIVLLCCWPVTIGSWLWCLRFLEWHRTLSTNRQKRLQQIFLSALLGSLVCFLPVLHLHFLYAFLGFVVILIAVDFYLDSNRTSMTWLLLWLPLVSALFAVFAFRQSLHIDSFDRLAIAQSIANQGIPDQSLKYPFDFEWDTLSVATAQRYFPTKTASLEAGEHFEQLRAQRTDLVYFRSDQLGFVMVGRDTNGYYPPLLLASLIFIVGLLYILLLRLGSWVLAYPIARWRLPLFGPASLRARIQLSFFAVAFAIFFLVGWFTTRFFQGTSGFNFSWLEQLLSLYAFLLLVAGALGIMLANSITEPIVQIGQKLGTTRLEDNEPLSWPRADEVGKLVSNYNQMIAELSRSAKELAAREREGAWREMAKQVAHEIKNPLTPMKLQLQQLLRLENEDPERARIWSQRVSKSIIEQIDGLALIATEFSNFARLPEAKPEAFDLRDLLQSAYELHQENTEDATLQLQQTATNCPIFADRDQLLRVLNNLIRNALQALDDERAGLITLQLRKDAHHCHLTVTDNGNGIPEKIQTKIFQPNFTTKSSGMGLGLAMCKNIVEQANGQLRFETVEGEGTTFELQLPLQLDN